MMLQEFVQGLVQPTCISSTLASTGDSDCTNSSNSVLFFFTCFLSFILCIVTSLVQT